MKIIESYKDFESIIANNTFVLIYFSGSNCSVCHSVKPKLESIFFEGLPDLISVEVSVERFPEVAARYMVFTIPAVLFLVDGKEFIRDARFIDVFALKEKIEKIGRLYA
jgi:thioredoxin-like negative regulator of GroEL